MNFCEPEDSLVYLLSDSQASLGYIIRPYLKNKIYFKFIRVAIIGYDR